MNTDRLRREISCNALAARVLREGIRLAKTQPLEQRSWACGNAWNRKRALGDGTRYLLLALALVRGRPYRWVEFRCAAGNEPGAESLRKEAALLAGYAGSVEDVKAWLEVPVTPEMVRRHEEALRRWWNHRDEMRAAHKRALDRPGAA